MLSFENIERRRVAHAHWEFVPESRRGDRKGPLAITCAGKGTRS